MSVITQPQSPLPQVFEPREGAAAGVAAVSTAAAVLWGVYFLAAAQSWTLKSVVLGAAVVASCAAVTVWCRYTEQKANSREHKQLLKRQQILLDRIDQQRREVSELRDDNRRIIALLQERANQDHAVKQDYWSAYSDGVSDCMPNTDPAAPVIQIRPRNGRHPE